jgi:hypothetical protein
MLLKSSTILAGALFGLALAMPASAAPPGAPASVLAQASDEGQAVQVQYRRGGGAVRGGGGGRGGGAVMGGRGGRGGFAGGGRGWGRRGGWDRGGAGAAAAIGALGVLGAIAGSQAVQEPYYEPAPVYAPRAYGGGGVRYCMQRYRSYDPYSRTYVGYDGQRYPCP